MTARAATTLLIATLALAAMAASATAAGSYTVTACSPTTSAGAWQQLNTDPAQLASGNQCGGPMIGPVGGGDAGALSAEDVLGGSPPDVPLGAEAGWSFQAPSGTTIIGVNYYRSLDTPIGAGGWQAGLYTQDGTALDICELDPTNNACSSPNNQVAVQVAVPNASGLFFGVKCVMAFGSPGCLDGASLHQAQADMYSVSVTLSESGTPTVSNVAGPLWGGGVLSGSATVTFGASDVSGIAQVTVNGPSGQVAQQPQSCDYYSTQPCPQLPSGSVSVNTMSLPDGAQTLTLAVTNAAGNTASVQSPQVIVDNNGPPAPSSFTATPVAGSDVIDLSWSDPANPPQPVSGAYVQLCQASCAAAVSVSYSGAAQLTAPAPGTYTLRLWLIDLAGHGSAANAATTAVTIPSPTQPSGPSGPSSPGGSTGPSGPTGAVGASTTKTRPKLRITRHRLKGHRLTLTVTVPAAVKGPVTLAVIGYHGPDQSCMSTRNVKARHGRASTTFVLTAMERTASRLLARASAAHATTAMVTVRKRSA